MSTTVGTGTLIRLILRRDRIRLPLWVLGISGVNAASAAAVVGTYDSPEEIATYGVTAGDSAATLITSGRQVALDTLDGIVANEITLTATLGVTLMVVFTVVRHTRAEEESGAAELLRSGVLGRHAAAVAALTVAVAASLLTGLLHTLLLLASDLDPAGSVAYGAAVALLGILFAGLSAAAAQVTAAARGALAIAGGLLAAAYVVRGVGAVADNALYWVSPFGWAQGVDAYGDERWWMLGVLAAGAAAAFAVAVALTARRDAGAGLISPRPGDARADRLLVTSPGLVLRGQRGLIIGWAAGLALLAALYGSVVPEVPELIESSPEVAEALGLTAGAGEALIDVFLDYIDLTLGVIGAAFGVASVLRLRHEEDSGRLEALLATGLTRTRWLGGMLAVSFAGLALMAVAMGLGMAAGYIPVAADASRAGDLVIGPVAQLPAMAVVAAIAFLLVAWAPRWSLVAWAVMAWVFVEAFLGETLDLPGAVRSLSPFHHLPRLISDGWDAVPTLALLAITAACVLAGLAGFRRRDVTASA